MQFDETFSPRCFLVAMDSGSSLITKIVIIQYILRKIVRDRFCKSRVKMYSPIQLNIIYTRFNKAKKVQ